MERERWRDGKRAMREMEREIREIWREKWRELERVGESGAD
jgi:hypothetical protein